ncbi:MAG: FHIPEP family type III secretion protein [Nitrospiraceae bacterium]
MSIDADLNAGLINESARHWRKQIAEEADFYGAMDGASKFVRGDAVAAIVITAVNDLLWLDHRCAPARNDVGCGGANLHAVDGR